MNTRIVDTRDTHTTKNLCDLSVLCREKLFKKSSESCLVNIFSLTLFGLLLRTHTHTEREREYIYIYDGFLRFCLFL